MLYIQNGIQNLVCVVIYIYIYIFKYFGTKIIKIATLPLRKKNKTKKLTKLYLNHHGHIKAMNIYSERNIFEI